MLTAYEASKNAYEINLNKIRKNVEEEIKEAYEHGHDEMHMSDFIPKEIFYELIDLGYEVFMTYINGHEATYIKWNRK